MPTLGWKLRLDRTMKSQFVAVVLLIWSLILNHLVAQRQQPLNSTQHKALTFIFDDLGATTSDPISVSEFFFVLLPGCLDSHFCKPPGEQEECAISNGNDFSIGCNQGSVTKMSEFGWSADEELTTSLCSDFGGRSLKGGKLKGKISSMIGVLTGLSIL